jgi:GT2 family glycosyltransferase
MKVYTIIVTYNGFKWIDKCFESLKQSSIAMNTIVIDNGSTDGTQEKIQSLYPDVDFIQSKENLGFGKANNIGIKKAYDAGADFVFLLNQDAWIEKDTLSGLVNVFFKHPEYGIISPVHLNGKGDALDFGFSRYINPTLCPNLVSDALLGKTQNKIYETKYVNAAAWMISRQCIEAVGGFNPLFTMYGEDDNYLQRVAFHGFKVGILPHVFIYHDREGRSSSTFLSKKSNAFKRSVLIKYCHPAETKLVSDEIKWRKRVVFKNTITLQFQKNKELQQEISALMLLSDEIEKTKRISQKRGLSFLDETQ